MLKKLHIFLITVFLVFSSNLCGAEYKTVMGDVSLLGIHAGDSYDYVVSVLGNPDHSSVYAYTTLSARWGDMFAINFERPNKQSNLIAIKIYLQNSKNQNNGINTPAGVHIGMPFEEAKRLYGIYDPSVKFCFRVLDYDKKTYMSISSTYDSLRPNQFPPGGVHIVKSITSERVTSERHLHSLEEALNY